MKRSQKQRLGRLAIEQIKQAYKDGQEFDSSVIVRQYCIDALGVKSSYVGLRMAADWDRQARYELADARYSVTSPVASNRYKRDPNATAEEREAAETPRWKDLGTRIGNIQRIATSAASQSDATRLEIEREVRIKIISEVAAPLTVEYSVAEKILAEALEV